MSRRDLQQYVTGETRVARQDRDVAVKAKEIYDEARLAALKADATMAFAGHIMERVVELDEYRRSMAGGDRIREVLLADIEQTAVLKAKKLQNRLFDEWGI